MKFRFQSFFDISTSAASMQVLQWAVGGKEVVDRCRHLFGAYKYFKLGKISIKMVPASTLPVDPQGLSYDLDDPQTVDPRDQMNPGLVRITNGEDIFTDVSALTEGQQEAVYNTMMLDPRWSKFMLQSGFRRSAYPLYWQVGQLSQDKYPGAVENIPHATADKSTVNGVDTIVTSSSGSNHDVTRSMIFENSSPRGLFQVGHRGKLGFLPTDYYQDILLSSNGTPVQSFGVNNVPEVSVVTCILPKAYKTLYYYRVFITEEVIFAGLRSAPAIMSYPEASDLQTIGLDTFLFGTPQAARPGAPLYRVTDGTINNNGDGDL